VMRVDAQRNRRIAMPQLRAHVPSIHTDPIPELRSC
jgi:hypothetical protein